ncbi:MULTISPECIES: TetR/AcrR family transcriptional regulator [Sphingobacterium]|uniref:TetR/AcrR family transcriptional regulator n=1 Tax=Sphingobacterium tenebrionis TaxID=3111775 RepID=A0ABU8I3W9_9SPHI|nr:TetR/AcrR family transcriptional regulator [Sphingobacterium sp. CZ-2]QBR12005.1 TetR/AcrR family transcriptional regulator [Sphingobacterium sp. CZ-2]
MAKSADAKRTKILEAAKKRFAHYGLAKTTMAEIAQDLSFSKALLYYYFPDKNSLFAAVMEATIDELLEISTAKIKSAKTVQHAIDAFLETRLHIIKENYNVFEFTYSLRNDMPPDLECAMPAMFEREIEQVRSILEMGVENGELKPIDDMMTTARILLISMLGMRLGILKEFKNLFFPPTKEEFDYILDLQRKLSKIFIDGLRK